jgi:hypothetical protein
VKKSLMILMLSLSMTVLAQEKYLPPIPSSGNVTLPLNDYDKLIELANKPDVKPESAPISFAIKRADLKLRVGSESVLGTVQCEGELFKKGISKIPLMNTPAVLSVHRTDKIIPLMQENGVHTAILSGPGEFSLTLDAGIPLNIETGRASFNLPVPAAGSAQLSLEIPGEHANAKISPGLITRRSTENGKTLIEATLVPDQVANIWWTTREIAAPAAPREIRFLSDIKTLVTISEADMRLAVLANISVIQGEPAQFEVEIPAGFEMTGVTGATLDSEELQSGRLILKTNGIDKKYHQFLISLEKPIDTTKADVPFLSFKGTQRETGEMLVEGAGTLELTATEKGTLKRMDLKEVNAYLRSLARNPLHAAFRYHRQPSEPPSLALSWNRFPDSTVLAAGAELGEITTLITSEGRSLTEIKLSVKNQAQPFLKVGLPQGASIVTADVAGQTVKPVQGSDGTIRVPLLRTGFRPTGLYQVTFVIMNAGASFAKKGDSQLSLPKMDIPISLLKWEVFLPERYKVKDFEGDAIATFRLPPGLPMPMSTSTLAASTRAAAGITRDGQNVNEPRYNAGINTPSQINQEIVDEFKVVLSPADAEYGRGNGQVIIKTKEGGGNTYNGAIGFSGGVNGLSNSMRGTKGNAPAVSNEASTNVLNLQRRVAGVLPIRVDVPHAGTSYSFVRPLVLDEETKVTFRYKSK